MRCASFTPPRRRSENSCDSQAARERRNAENQQGGAIPGAAAEKSKRLGEDDVEDRRRAMKLGGGKKNAVADEEFRPKRRFKVSGTMFEVDAKYELIKPIGLGAYGVVISALNTETGQKVAIKKITRAFDDLVDAKRILREITLLRKFSHDNIITIVDILVPPSSEEFEDVYIVSDLMETDLHRIINSKQELSLDHVQYFLYQVLRALKYMHSSNVLHRDLKPSNLLLNSNCDLKVCDLGLARDIESGCQELTEYVVTRWYRAPEIMLACAEYSKAIDVWSVGCIFAELMLRRPFFPGDHYLDQLRLICDKLGKPKEDDLTFVTTNKARRFIMNLSDTPPQNLRSLFPATASDEALDLLCNMLEFNPEKRISVEAALRHPFMRSLHAAKDEPTANFEFCFGFEAEEPSKHRLQELMWEEMRRYHPEQGPWKGKQSSSPAESQSSSNPETSTSARAFSCLGEEQRSSPAQGSKQSSTAPLGRSPVTAAASGGSADRTTSTAATCSSLESDATSSGKQPPVSATGVARERRPALSPPVATRLRRKSRLTVAAAAIAGVKPARAPIAATDTTAVAAPKAASTIEAQRDRRPSSEVTSPVSPSVSSSSSEPHTAPRARTRATARGRVNGRTTACSSSYVHGSSDGPGAAEQLAMGSAAAAETSIPMTAGASKRQRVARTQGAACPARPTAGWLPPRKAFFPDTTPTVLGHARRCHEAPADGTSEFLSQAGFEENTPSQIPNIFGKQRMVEGAAGPVPPSAKNAAVADETA